MYDDVLDAALAGVAEHREHDLSRAEALRHLERRPAVRSGRDAEQHAFLARQPPRELRGVLIGDRDDLVDDLEVEILGHEARADALNLVIARLSPGDHWRRRRLDRDDARAGTLLLQHLPDAGDRPTRADAGDERVDPRHLLENLLRG